MEINKKYLETVYDLMKLLSVPNEKWVTMTVKGKLGSLTKQMQNKSYIIPIK